MRKLFLIKIRSACIHCTLHSRQHTVCSFLCRSCLVWAMKPTPESKLSKWPQTGTTPVALVNTVCVVLVRKKCKFTRCSFCHTNTTVVAGLPLIFIISIGGVKTPVSFEKTRIATISAQNAGTVYESYWTVPRVSALLTCVVILDPGCKTDLTSFLHIHPSSWIQWCQCDS